MKNLIALLVSLAMLSPATAQTPYDELNKRLQHLSKQSNAALDKLTAAMLLDQECKAGIKTGDICAQAKVSCQHYIAAFNESDEAFKKMRAEIEAAPGITDSERDFLIRAHGMIDLLKSAVRNDMVSTSCTDV